MKHEGTRRKRREQELLRDESEQTGLYACAECGTLASTNSGKHFTQNQYIDTEEEHDGITWKNSVRMAPPCPCGCDVFNPVFVEGYRREDVT